MSQQPCASSSEVSETYTKPAINSPAWINIPCTSVPRARDFYTSVFGWSFFSPPGISSESLSPESFSPFKIPGSAIMGGLRKSDGVKAKAEGDENPKDDGLVVYVMVEDVDVTLKKVVEAGGKVKMEKFNEGGHTDLGSFFDTEGNVVGILKWLI